MFVQLAGAAWTPTTVCQNFNWRRSVFRLVIMSSLQIATSQDRIHALRSLTFYICAKTFARISRNLMNLPTSILWTTAGISHYAFGIPGFLSVHTWLMSSCQVDSYVMKGHAACIL